MAKPRHQQLDYRGLEILADEFTSAEVAAITVLTDSSAGTPTNTIVAIPAATQASTDTSAASLTSTNASLAAIRNEVASLTAKVNAIINALK